MDVRIPSQIDGLPVTEIGEDVFVGGQLDYTHEWVTGHQLTSVVIPNIRTFAQNT
jgi:hypothetical protein